MKKLLYSIILVSASLALLAQEPEITLPGGVYGGFNVDDDGVVGAIGGTVNVSALGGATYNIPIMVPDGINGLQPNLGIVYNSQGGNGLLGWSWSLTGLSSITRTGQSMFFDDTITSVDFEHDRFVLDGQRLMLVNEAPYGGNGAEYKTEIDGMNKIVSYTCDTTQGPAMFKVWLANGNIAFYGSRYNSRIGLKESNNVCFWLLDSIVDRNGNYMSYHYCRGDIAYYIDYIAYTGHRTINSVVSPQYKVKFLYDQGDRLDKEQSFVGNNSLWQTKLLKGIKVFHEPTSTLLHQYDFDYCGLGLNPALYSYEQNNPPSELAYYYNRLNTVSFSKGDCHYNPTRIEWGENDYDADNYRSITMVTQEGGQDGSIFDSFNDKVKFAGDFNGDGLTDIVVHVPSSPDYAKVYINRGNYKRPENNHFVTKLRFRQLPENLLLNDNIDWIYVADFNGDGLDDMLCLSRDRNSGLKDKIFIDGYIARLDNGEVRFDSIHSEDQFYKIKKTYAEAVFVGDFLGEGKCQFFMPCYDPSKEEESLETAYLFEYQNGMFKKIAHWTDFDLDADKYTAADFNGDGVTEIIYSSEDDVNCKMVRIVKRSLWGVIDYFCFQEITDFCLGLTYWHQIFPGDFNGDGHIDLLTYVPGPNGGEGSWQISLFKGDNIEYPCYTIGSSEIGIGDPGNHGFSIQDRWAIGSQFHFVEVADMNGDGKTDVVVRLSHGNEEVFRVLYAPLRRVNGTSRFADIQEFPLSGSGTINNQTFCVGHFYGTETACFVATNVAGSRVPISNRYVVSSITDGMGNRNNFSYDYLTFNPLKDDNIYSLSNPGTNLGNDIYHIALPMKAVRKTMFDNAFDNAVPKAQTEYSYENIFAHRKGRGALGFEKTVELSFVGNTVKGKTVSESEVASMGDKCLALPSTVTTYDNQEYMLAQTNFVFRKYVCRRDPGRKVFIVKPIKQFTDNYEILGSRSFLRRRIVEKDYTYSMIQGGTNFYYNDAVLEKKTIVGTDAAMVNTADDCEYKSTSETMFETNDYINWIIGRPNTVKTNMECASNHSVVKAKVTYEYQSANPFLPSKVSRYPDHISSLGTYTTYSYDGFGHIVDEITNSFSGGLQSSKGYGYSADGRFLETESIIADGVEYTDEYVYSPIDGYMRIAKDCNDFYTYSNNDDRMGVTVYSSNHDPQGNVIGGSRAYDAVRWLNGSGYEDFGERLTNPAYFKWNWRQDKAESLVVYDASGRALRSVTFGLTLNDTIYVDTKYDGQGRVSETSEPYFAADGPLSVGKTSYEYDDYDRLVETTIYDKYGGVLLRTRHDYIGLETVTTTFRTNGNKEIVSDCLNIMGWKDRHLDCLDPEAPGNPANQVVVQYGYYADGKLAWTKTISNGNYNNDDTKIIMEYDALGNRTRLFDPDYGETVSNYNAFGQLCWTTTPKGDLTEYVYDGLGRTVQRIEYDRQNNNQVETLWNYLADRGRKGLLESVNYGSGDQIVSYKYDALNRVEKVMETMNNATYVTNYEYDGYSRVKKTEYPNHYVTRNVYSAETGLRVAIKDDNWQTLWKMNEMNAMGQIVEYQTGDGAVSKRIYDNMHRLERQLTKVEDAIIQDLTYGYDDFGNLTSRTENKYTLPITECFGYDRLNRLDTIKLNNVTSLMEYDPHGRILSKQVDGATVFSGAQYSTYDLLGNLKPHAISSATMADGFFPGSRLEAEYTMFDKVKSIAKYSDNNTLERTLTYTYGYDHQRVHMEERVGGNVYRTKTYVGNSEYIYDTDCRRSLTYLSAPTGLFAVYIREGSQYLNDEDPVSQRLLYLHTDHLGSITTITDASGAIQQELSYDAWGNLRNPTTWSGSFTGTPLLDRGFTGHEHLSYFGLINMNGRMYDPVMSSFLSVDSYVQDPENSQNFNRYAYCLNNPLGYSDPSGEIVLSTLTMVGIGVATAIGGYTGYCIATSKGYDFSNWQTYGYMLGGAAVGFASGYVGATVCAGGGFMANTAGLIGSSMVNMAGTTMLSGGSYIAPISFGAASFDLMTGEWGYLGKKGNFPWQNIGYAFGALANLQDVVAGGNGTSIDVKSRPNLFGHSELGDYSKNDILVSNRPNWDIDAYYELPFKEETGVSLIDDYNWEMTFVKEQFKGNPFPGKNAPVIKTGDPVVNVSLTNVNGKIMRAITNNLNNGRNLLNIGKLKYGILYGCVNMTSRALLYSGVINANAFLPITSPLFLQAELAIRQLGIYANPFLIQKF